MTFALRCLAVIVALLAAAPAAAGPTRDPADKEKSRYHREGSRETLKDMFVGTLGDEDHVFDRRAAAAAAPDPDCGAVSSDSLLDDQYYDVYDIEVADGAPIAIEMVSATFEDGYLLLYCEFDPDQPEDNLIFGDDDDGAALLAAILPGDGVQLAPGTNYHLVVTSFYSRTTGSYQMNTSDNVVPGGSVPTRRSHWGAVKERFQ